MAVLRELALDPVTWDILMVNGDWVWLEGKEAVAQRIEVCLKTLLAEWRFDESIGTPWLQSIMGHGAVPDALVRQIIYQQVQRVQGVDSVLRLLVERDRATRTVRISGAVTAGSDEVLFSTERAF